MKKANLGYATTLELLREIAARITVSDTIGEEIDLNYKTVTDEPTKKKKKPTSKLTKRGRE